MVVVIICGSEGVSGYVAGVWGRTIIAPRSAAECWWIVILWMVQDVNGTFFMFAPEFCDKGKSPARSSDHCAC